MNRILALSFVFLSGCSTMEPFVRTVEVEVPIRVPCDVEVRTAPNYSYSSATKQQQIDEKTKLLLAEVLEREQMERELRAALQGCKQ